MTEAQENRHTLRKMIKTLQALVDDENIEVDHVDLEVARDTNPLRNGSPPESGITQHVLVVRTRRKSTLKICPA